MNLTQLPTRGQLQFFGLLIITAAALIWVGIPYLQTGEINSAVLLWFSIGLLTFVTLLKPMWLTKPYTAWLAIGGILGKINATVILGVFFVLVIVPLGFTKRLFLWDPLRLMNHRKRGVDSYYLQNQSPVDDFHIERPY